MARYKSDLYEEFWGQSKYELRIRFLLKGESEKAPEGDQGKEDFLKTNIRSNPNSLVTKAD